MRAFNKPPLNLYTVVVNPGESAAYNENTDTGRHPLFWNGNRDPAFSSRQRGYRVLAPRPGGRPAAGYTPGPRRAHGGNGPDPHGHRTLGCNNRQYLLHG